MTRAKSIAWSAATVVLAALISFVVVHLTLRSYEEDRSDPSTTSTRDLHQWLHENLGITHEQENRLLPIESRFERDRTQLHGEIKSAGQRLAEAIRDFDPDSQEVASARGELTRAQGELQQITLDHFFAMKEHLTPEQGARLLEWTHRSILDGYDE